MIEPITLDFETEAIVGNPLVNPPRPVGLAVWVPGQEPAYMSFGHPSGNNCSWGDCRNYLRTILRETKRPLLFHNAGFDVSVAAEWFFDGIENWPWRQWERIHDTMYLLFLADPYASTLSLKPSAYRYLSLPPTEQTDLKNWILSNVPAATENNWGAYISKAPGDIVGPYAVGDVIRTRGLFDLLHARIVADGMEAAYDRERRLFPITCRATRRGIRIDRDTLAYHENVYTKCLEIAETRLAAALDITVESLSEGSNFVDALERKGYVTDWTLTKTGKRSKAKDNLRINNDEIRILYEYSSGLRTCLQTFMRPWLDLSRSDGRVHPNWNQVKQSKDAFRSSAGLKGTQTGRLSSDSPNFQNVPTEFTYADGSPLAVPPGLHPLPLMRRYCQPEVGHTWIKRDFSSQEIRILAHFEDGSLRAAYCANPELDPHKMARGIILDQTGKEYARPSVKITAFSIIYGAGVPGLSHQLGQPMHEAAEIKSAYLGAMPDVEELMDDVQARGRAGLPVRTWGGRLYYTEPPKEVKGRLRSFEYKLLNYIIQGSAADQTKEALIEWDSAMGPESVFLATVHDELNGSVPEEQKEREMAILKECMNRDRFDVPFRSEGFWGPNWADIEAAD